MQTLRNLKKSLIFGLLTAFSFSNVEAVYRLIENRTIKIENFEGTSQFTENNAIKVFGPKGHLIIKNCCLIIDGFHPLTCENGGKIHFINCIIVLGLGSQIPQPMRMDGISQTNFTNCIITLEKEASIPRISNQIIIDSQTTFLQQRDSETKIALLRFSNFEISEVGTTDITDLTPQLKYFVQKSKDAELVAQIEAEAFVREDFPDSDDDKIDNHSLSVSVSRSRSNASFCSISSLSDLDVPRSPTSE